MAALLGEEPPRPAEQDDAQGGMNINGTAAAADGVKQEDGSNGVAGVKVEEAAGGIKAEPAEAAGAAPMDTDGAAAAAGVTGGEQQGAAPPAGGAAALQASGSSAALVKDEEQEQGQLRGQGSAEPPAAAAAQQQQQAGLPPRPPSPGALPAGKPPLHPTVAKLAKADSMQPSSAGVSQSGAEGGGTETEAGTTVEQREAQPLHPVSLCWCALRGRDSCS